MKKNIVSVMCLILALLLAGCGERVTKPQPGTAAVSAADEAGTTEPTESAPPTEAIVEDVRGEWTEFEKLYDYAAELSQKYGVSIFVGDTVPDWLGVERCDDAEMTRECLEATDEVLGCYPEGFFRGLPYDCFDRIYLYITGTGGTAGVYSSGDNYLWVRVDANCMSAGKGFYAYTLHHELCHMIDCRMQSQYPGHQPSIDSEEWNSYNPEGFQYAGPEDEKQIEVYDTAFDYFAFSYGTCSELEDRAICFGNAMAYYQNVDLLPTWIEQPHCREKYEFFCRCIRREFGWENAEGVLPWEEALK